SVCHVSNVLGGREPVEEVVKLAHTRGVPVLVDGAQAAPHIPVDVRKIGCDFYAFSGHKTYGPSGAGVLYGTTEWLEKLPPSLGVAVRAGHLRARPLMRKFGIGGAVRASFGVYNTPAEVGVLVEAVERCARRAGR